MKTALSGAAAAAATGSGAYKCEMCCRMTQRTGEPDGLRRLCGQCFHLMGYEIMVWGEQFDEHDVPRVNDLIAEAIRLGGSEAEICASVPDLIKRIGGSYRAEAPARAELHARSWSRHPHLRRF
jgi:hypothetical protein